MHPAGADQVIAFHHIVRNERLALQLADGDASKLSGFDNGSGGVGGYARLFGVLALDLLLYPGGQHVLELHLLSVVSSFTGMPMLTTRRRLRLVGAARQALCSVDDEEIVKRCAGSRFALVNAWRSISDSSPVVTHPLALLDATTVCEDDVVLVDLLYPGFVSESLQITFSPKHRWLYWPSTRRRSVLGSGALKGHIFYRPAAAMAPTRRSPLLVVLALAVAACSPAFLMPGLRPSVPEKTQQLVAGAALVASMPAPAHAGGMFDFGLTLPFVAGSFLLLMAVLNALFYAPVSEEMEERNSKLLQTLSDATDMLAEADEMQVQYTAEIKEAREKAAKEPDDVMHWGSGFRVTSFRSEVSSSKSGMCSRASGGSSSRGAPSI
ncbi:atpF2 [Symbiodinium microadriaticum]|nr:atpF2 [Symbiodinium microadriaticum]